ncbi:grainyhead-like protein 2 homolog [Aspergillus udagawae]|nr:grainyhead-like protein 2 homolog [Aspergillus udagawae]
MFDKRTAQKPGAELIGDFRKKFSHVIADPFLTQQAPLEHGDAKLANHPILPSQQYHLQFNHHASNANVVDYVAPSALQAGLLTPTANQMCAVVHSPAGDLHTPTVEWNLASTPWIWDQMVSVQSELQDQQPQPAPPPPPPPQQQLHGHAATATRGVVGLQSQYQHHLFQNMDPFASNHILPSNVSFGANSDYDPLDTASHRNSFTELLGHVAQPLLPVASDEVDRADFPSKPETPFRYRVTLHAPTAIADHAHEPPVTYLNKSQAYSVSIIDSTPPAHATQPVKYRTSVRITFEEPAHRSNPARCWRLWKEARGAVEAQQRGGKMRALEFVDLRIGSKKNAPRLKKVVSASFDGFCVTWSSTPEAGSSECVVNVRLNFLSTDFSLSKGVKGVPTRLCVKTEMIGLEDGTPAPGPGTEAEICYCKVKVFRDHGAERKLSNDVAHVQKAIHKVERQIAQGDVDGNNGLGKRKRRKGVGHGLTKNHTVSMSLSPSRSNSLTGVDDLHRALFELRNLFSSSQPVSLLSLQGDVLDDPDQSPVSLPRDASTPVSLGRDSASENDAGLNFHGDLVELPRRPFGREASTVEPKIESPDPGLSDINGRSSPESDTGDRSSSPRHVACFYVRIQDKQQQEPYYRAVYLTERTASDFLDQLSKKYNVQPDRILSLVHINPKSLRVAVDDDVVGAIPEGQDMIAQFTEVPAPLSGDGQDDGERHSTGYEVQLLF